MDVGDGAGPLTEFLTLLALCHTVIPERPNDTDEVSISQSILNTTYSKYNLF